jgi:mono/diheme cytochrome c family protein
MSEPTSAAPETPRIYGVLAELPSATALVAAAKRVRETGIKRFDAHSPYPVHGIDAAMGTRMTRLPWLVLVGGITGLVSGLLLQWWTNAVDYPLVISAKPLFSLPANIPVIFELTVLFAGLCAFLGVLALNLLPSHHHPLFTSERFHRATSDGFFISVEAGDKRFVLDEVTALLRSCGATSIETLMETPAAESRLPRGLVFGAVVVVIASLVPFALFMRARVSTSTTPPILMLQDMVDQPKYLAQSESPLFANRRAYRDQVPGTVAVEDTTDDGYLWQGKVGGAFATSLPPSVPLSEATMQRGRERFGIYCAPCHGLAGGGDGPVARRAEQLREGTWVPPTNLGADSVRAQPLGQLVNTITNGIRNMPGYGPQLAPRDRWAIALYVKALQRSMATSVDDVPEADRPGLK